VSKETYKETYQGAKETYRAGERVKEGNEGLCMCVCVHARVKVRIALRGNKGLCLCVCLYVCVLVCVKRVSDPCNSVERARARERERERESERARERESERARERERESARARERESERERERAGLTRFFSRGGELFHLVPLLPVLDFFLNYTYVYIYIYFAWRRAFSPGAPAPLPRFLPR